MQPEEVGARDVRGNDDGRRAIEPAMEGSSPPPVHMRRGLGHHLEREVVHDQNDPPDRCRRRHEVGRQDEIRTSGEPLDLGESDPGVERLEASDRQPRGSLGEVRGRAGEPLGLPADGADVQIPRDEPRRRVGTRQVLDHGTRIHPDARPSGIDRRPRVDEHPHRRRKARRPSVARRHEVRRAPRRPECCSCEPERIGAVGAVRQDQLLEVRVVEVERAGQGIRASVAVGERVQTVEHLDEAEDRRELVRGVVDGAAETVRPLGSRTAR